jgi:SAM-dependent methyltransferase
MVLPEALTEHLKWWGLRRFDTDQAYYQWQRERIRPTDLQQLNRLVEDRRLPNAAAVDEAFYDLAARADLAEVLYSQRYNYYRAIGPLIAERIGSARTILDFGCGIGVLATFYARQFPDRSFVGIDRSAGSLKLARTKAAALGLSNVRFERLEAGPVPVGIPFSRSVDLIISTHTLLQTERDLGIPSTSWKEFSRPADDQLQRDFEQRTGLGARLDALCEMLTVDGRLLLFEKTRLLARRIPFQRALATRGFRLLEAPTAVRYTLIEEVTDDGPLYLVSRSLKASDDEPVPQWDETPESSPTDALARYRGDQARGLYGRLPNRRVRRHERVADPELGSVQIELGTAEALAYLLVEASDRFSGLLLGPADLSSSVESEVTELFTDSKETGSLRDWLRRCWPVQMEGDVQHGPLYENHTVIAQSLWENLPGRRVRKTETFRESDGRQMHIELGEAGSCTYLYWANTFDQRQVVMIEQPKKDLLEDYYAELLTGGRTAAREP